MKNKVSISPQSLVMFYSDYISFVNKKYMSCMDIISELFNDIIISEKLNSLKIKKEDLSNFYSSIIIHKEKYDFENMKNSPEYNVFKIIGRSNSNPDGYSKLETKTHTPFINDLLDCNGNHGQKTTFYKLLISSIPKLENDSARMNFFSDVSGCILATRQEHRNIDIFIRAYSKDKNFGVIIENKLNDAGDQDKQLERYYRYASNNCGLSDIELLVLYVTPNGRVPGVGSIKKEECERLVNNKILYCMSARDVELWLKKCIDNCSSESVKGVMCQYKKIVKEIVNEQSS